MHFVDCGAEPPSLRPLEKYDARGNPVWNPECRKAEYSAFISDLQSRFNSLCAYCERRCERPPSGKKPERDQDNTVDHFRPRSRFPDRTFEWENLVYACYRCNTKAKGNKFPSPDDSSLPYLAHALRYAAKSNFSGAFVSPDCYVNPREPDERAEEFFAFDANGEILPAEGLRNDEWSKAVRTIADLELNPPDKRGRRRTDLSSERATLWKFAKRLSEDPALAQMPRPERDQELEKHFPKGLPFPTLVNWVLDHPD